MGSRFPNDVDILTIDLAKIGFQVCGATSTGGEPSNRKFSPWKLQKFFCCPCALSGRDGSLLWRPGES